MLTMKIAPPSPRTPGFHTFQILNSRVKNIKKLVCCSLDCIHRPEPP